MKNKMLLTLSIVGIAGLLVSCNTTGNTSSTGNTSTSTSTPSPVSSSTTPISSTTDKVTYKQGLGTSIDFKTDKNDVITQANVYVASVIFDSTNKIVSAYIDELQIPLTYTAASGDTAAKLEFTAGKAQITSSHKPEGQAVASKKELLEDYGMAGTATKGEWNVQALAYETWAVGKDAAALNAAVGKDNKPSDSDLAADVSITVNGFTSSVVESLTHVRKDSYK